MVTGDHLCLLLLIDGNGGHGDHLCLLLLIDGNGGHGDHLCLLLLIDGNGGRIHVILNSEALEEVDCFKYLGSQVTADGGCERDLVHRMNSRRGERWKVY